MNVLKSVAKAFILSLLVGMIGYGSPNRIVGNIALYIYYMMVVFITCMLIYRFSLKDGRIVPALLFPTIQMKAGKYYDVSNAKCESKFIFNVYRGNIRVCKLENDELVRIQKSLLTFKFNKQGGN